MTQSERAEILSKLQRYCAYQDRCHQEVRQKLLKLKVYGQDLEDIIYELVQEDFLNEERFARSYARGKHRIKKWGRHRIENELKQRQISDYCRRKAMEEIDEELYGQNLQDLKDMYERKYKGLPHFEAQKKTIAALQRKGYGYEEIREIINDDPTG